MDKKSKFLPLRWPVFINVAKDYLALDTDGMKLFTISTQYTADRIPFFVFGNQFFELNMDYRYRDIFPFWEVSENELTHNPLCTTKELLDLAEQYEDIVAFAKKDREIYYLMNGYILCKGEYLEKEELPNSVFLLHPNCCRTLKTHNHEYII